MTGARFTKETFRFLDDLKKNNDREWFAASKKRYEQHIKDPALGIIEGFAPELKKISPHFMATPRSLFGSTATSASPRTRAPTRPT